MRTCNETMIKKTKKNNGEKKGKFSSSDLSSPTYKFIYVYTQL